ncbi:hypothetical protein ACJX0J_040945, partial [Zea mays]
MTSTLGGHVIMCAGIIMHNIITGNDPLLEQSYPSIDNIIDTTILFRLLSPPITICHMLCKIHHIFILIQWCFQTITKMDKAGGKKYLYISMQLQTTNHVIIGVSVEL